MIAFYRAASLPAALVKEQTSSGASIQLDSSDQVKHFVITVLATAIPKLLLSPSTNVRTLAVCRQHHTTLSRTTRPEHRYLCTHYLRSSIVGAETGPINSARPSLSGCSYPEVSASHYLVSARLSTAQSWNQQNWFILKMHKCWSFSAILSCRGHISYGTSLLTVENRT